MRLVILSVSALQWKNEFVLAVETVYLRDFDGRGLTGQGFYWRLVSVTQKSCTLF